MRNPLSIIILLLWFLLGLAYCNASKDCCSGDLENNSAIDSSQTATGALANQGLDDSNTNNTTSSNTVLSADSLSNLRGNIISKLNPNQLLEITGYYSPDEVNNTSFENLGLARASEIRKLYPELPDDRVRLSSKMIDGYKYDPNNPYANCDYNYRVNTDKIKEIDQKTLIYFPQNSVDKLNDAEVEAYLDDVVKALSGNDKKVKLTGHTDRLGGSNSNLVLGQGRADIIKKYLVSKGLPSNRIISTSEGESNPIDNNDTKEGRANNRRTELEIIN
jgi:outer membrane protein OmpA-like peptidoglycan-associated protein